MWRRKTFRQACGWLSHIRGKAAGGANRNPKAMIAGMFCVMASGSVWLLARPVDSISGIDETVKALYSGFDKGQQRPPVTADILEVWKLYDKVRSVNPDSLSARDSTFLKGIDQQLNRIIHE